MVFRLAIIDFFGGMLTLPVWWYTRGLSLMLAWFRRTVREASELFALGVWVRNLFVPMYGETEWSGRLISFLVRAVMIVARGSAVGFWTLLASIALAAYVCALPLAVVGIFYHGFGTLFSHE